MKQGARTDLSPIGGKSQSQAAEMLNVGKRTVERAKQVITHGTPELVAAVDRGDVTVSKAMKEAKLTAPKTADKYLNAQEERLGPIAARPLSKDQIADLKGAIASIKSVQNRIREIGIAEIATALTAAVMLIERHLTS
jgi:hypothetical protein